MLTKLSVKNFRSIEDCDVEFGPITVFFGPTSAGKSTLFYALLVLRNFILNPNQALDGLFNLGFQNLGGFEACVFNHSVSKTLGVTAHFGERRSYGVHLRKADADIVGDSEFLPMRAKVPVPYGANQTIAAIRGLFESRAWPRLNIMTVLGRCSPSATDAAPLQRQPWLLWLCRRR